MPEFIVIAGPNGSGKSTLTTAMRLRDTMPVLDPDAIALRLGAARPEDKSLAAGRAALLQMHSLLEQRTSFAIETTLAGNGPIERIREARNNGYRVRVYYLALADVELHLERIRQRVRSGGHGIPEDDVRRRYERSLAQAPVALGLSDEGAVLDNRRTQPEELFGVTAGRISWRAHRLPPWAEKIAAQLE